MVALTTALYAAALALVGNVIFGIWRRYNERRSIAAALAGEIGAYVKQFDPPTTVAAYRTMAAMDHATRRRRLRSMLRAPEGHPVFDKLADRVGLLPVTEALEVSSIYNVVTGMRVIISGLSSDAFADADDEMQIATLCSLADGIERNFRSALGLVERLEKISHPSFWRLVPCVALPVAGMIAVGFLWLGSSDDGRVQYYRCRLELSKSFPGENLLPYSHAAEFVGSCMGAAGYEIIVSRSCPLLEGGGRIQDPDCFAPLGSVPHALQDLKRKLTRRNPD